jgi:hypothetical protein
MAVAEAHPSYGDANPNGARHQRPGVRPGRILAVLTNRISPIAIRFWDCHSAALYSQHPDEEPDANQDENKCQSSPMPAWLRKCLIKRAHRQQSAAPHDQAHAVRRVAHCVSLLKFFSPIIFDFRQIRQLLV